MIPRSKAEVRNPLLIGRTASWSLPVFKDRKRCVLGEHRFKGGMVDETFDEIK